MTNMILENSLEVIEQRFNSRSIKKTIKSKRNDDIKCVYSKLSKYSNSEIGYKHQLELLGYKEIK